MKNNKEEIELMNGNFDELLNGDATFEGDEEIEQQFAHVSWSPSDVLSKYPDYFRDYEEVILWFEDNEDEIREAMTLAGREVIDALIPDRLF